MKVAIVGLILVLIGYFCVAQPQQVDSLKRELTRAKNDTVRVLLYAQLVQATPDHQVALSYGRQGLRLAKHLHYETGIIQCSNSFGVHLVESDYYEAIPILMEAMQMAKKHPQQHSLELVKAVGYLGYAYNKFDPKRALYYYRQCKKLMQKFHFSEQDFHINFSIGNHYKVWGSADSALAYMQTSYRLAQHFMPDAQAVYARFFGEIYAKLGQPEVSMRYFRQAIATHQKDPEGEAYQGMALLYRDRNQPDSARFYARGALRIEQRKRQRIYVIAAANLLFDLTKKSDPLQAIRYLQLASATKDSLHNQDKARQVEKLAFEEQEREARTQRRIEAYQQAFQTKIKLYSLAGALFVVLLLAFVLFRNNRQKHKANTLLQQQRDEVNFQRHKAEKALADLLLTQDQLIQKEKMASLGELTAGIAHEIQNPLNFVNNFAEVSTELVAELEEERQKGHTDPSAERDEGLEAELLSDLKQNLQKITQHGQRASSIVRGMLEHSRTSTGERQPTNLNALADEYLRLSYQGLRAKDKTFNCELITDFTPGFTPIDVVPQDIGRVLLNLYNNAFYAVQARQKTTGSTDYKPTVSVSTRFIPPSSPERAQSIANPTGVGNNRVGPTGIGTNGVGGFIELRVRDNGTGIPKAIQEKIFQPFFTTKPTGEGTGLGLSLSYDIITKGHGGTLTIESVEGVGTEFRIGLPIT